MAKIQHVYFWQDIQTPADEVFMGMSLGSKGFKPEVFGCLGFWKIFQPFGLLKHVAKITAGWWFQIFFLFSALFGEDSHFDIF